MMKGFYGRTTTVAVVSILLSSLVIAISGQTGGRSAVAIDNDDIGGVVTGARGPEAGVWVIAETRTLPTRFIRSVVTDDQGRYLVPDLPKADYDVWVRGYGLVDSPKVKATPGQTVNLKARRSAGQEGSRAVLPGAVLVRADADAAEERLPRHRSKAGTASRRHVRSQGEWIRNVVNTDGCTGCHQMGGAATRTIPTSFKGGSKDSTCGVGSADQVGTSWRRHERAIHAGRPRTRARRCTRTGPIASRQASFPPPSRRVRRARSATSWSRCGTGRIRRSICTTRSRATSAIRP